MLDEQFANLDQNALLKHVRVVHISKNSPQLIWRNTALLSVRNVNLGQFLTGTKQKCSFRQLITFSNVPTLVRHLNVLFPTLLIVRLSVARQLQQHQAFSHSLFFLHLQSQSDEVLDRLCHVKKWIFIQFNCTEFTLGPFVKVFLQCLDVVLVVLVELPKRRQQLVFEVRCLRVFHLDFFVERIRFKCCLLYRWGNEG